MKTAKIVYYSTTILIALMMLYSTYAYLTSEQLRQTFAHLGYPDYFRIELAIAKFIGAIMLITPVSLRWKDLAYGGFAFTFISAIIAHLGSGDPVNFSITPLIFLVILAASFFSYQKWHHK